jgi:hypothetical protein
VSEDKTDQEDDKTKMEKFTNHVSLFQYP